MAVGEGRTMLLTTSEELGMTDLPLRSGFPALIQRVVRYLAGAPSGTADPHYTAGAPGVRACTYGGHRTCA